MMSRELQIVGDPPLTLESPRAPVMRRGNDSEAGSSFVIDAMRKRWWLLGLCLVISGCAAYFAATQFGKEDALCRGSLMYTGLPPMPGPIVYQAPSLVTYREILFSPPNMQRICDQHGLAILPSALAERFQCTVKQGSSIMDLSLHWENHKDGIAIVNDTMRLLVDEAVRQRKEILNEHMRFLEESLLTAKSEVDAAVEQLRTAQRQRDERLREGGLSGDRYTSALDRVTTTQAALDTLHVNKLGVEQRIARLDTNAQELIKLLQRAHVDVRLAVVDQLVKPYKPGSERWIELRDIHTRIQTLGKNDPPLPREYVRWKAELAEIGQGVWPTTDVLETTEIRQVEEQLRTVLSDREKSELDLIPIANQITFSQARVDEYEQQAAKLGDDVAGISSTELDDYENKVDVLEGRLNLIKQQLDNMRQLESCRTPEFSISMPASLETALLDSNKKKLFVLVLVALASLLCAPVFGLEWLAQRASPVARFANRWGLPVVAERLLANCNSAHSNSPNWRTDEAVRMTTLRIQQCMGRSGSVVMFSSLNKTPSPIKLMLSIAECLARREERVLIVDAIDPTHGAMSLASNSSGDRPPSKISVTANARTAIQAALPKARTVGLSEYLSRECDGVADLIQPTSCPGVDLISAGDRRFPIEAMASSCITELFEHCRNTYSVILVAGPPVVARADFQMLAARADGILLAASRAALNDEVSREAVQDLIDLRAPVIGIVA